LSFGGSTLSIENMGVTKISSFGGWTRTQSNIQHNQPSIAHYGMTLDISILNHCHAKDGMITRCPVIFTVKGHLLDRKANRERWCFKKTNWLVFVPLTFSIKKNLHEMSKMISSFLILHS
jgi:hypothetical protein